MSLEQIVSMYGWTDYYDQHTGQIFHLLQVLDNGDGTLSVPVTEGGYFIGHVEMRDVR